MKSAMIKEVLSTFALILICGFIGFVSGIYYSTGTIPAFTETEQITTPEIAKPLITDVHETLDEVDFPEYEFGYNCVDFAWEASRALAWEGYPTAIVVIRFDTKPYHALLLMATEDEGWVFIEPQAGKVVRPVVGGIYNGRRIIEMRVLVLHWVDYLEWQKSPIFEEVINE